MYKRQGYENLTDAVQGTLENMQSLAFTAVVGVFCLVMIGYAVFKVFFSNLKRGGILLILIAVGSLYMFGIPRGYLDGFHGWCKQVVGLCLTTFLQSTILIAGLMVFREQLLLGLGLMLSAGEIPRLAGHFGMESGTRANLMGSIYAVDVYKRQAAEYLESWNEQILLQRLDEEGLRGLAYYLNDQDIKKQVFSMDAELTMRQGTLYLKFSCHLKHALTDMEAEALDVYKRQGYRSVA